MAEMDRAEQVMRERVLAPPPVSLARGESWPVAWHELEGFAAVLFVQASPYVSRWRRTRYDLLVAQLISEDGGPFVCESVGGTGPGPPGDPFGPPPHVGDDFLVDGGTATRVDTSDQGELLTEHSLGWGRAAAGVSVVELRTDIESVRVPVVSASGHFIAIARGRDPSLIVGVATGRPGSTPGAGGGFWHGRAGLGRRAHPGGYRRREGRREGSVVGRDEALHALRRELIGRDFVSASVLEVNDCGPVGFVLRVRAGRRVHPHTVVVAADERSLAFDHAWQEPLADDDAEQWAWGVALWLEQQFGSAVLRWGPRVVLDDGTSAVDLRAEPEVMPNWPGEVSEVPLDRLTPAGQRRLHRLALRKGLGRRPRAIVVLGDEFGSEPDPAPGGHLADAGLDVRAGRAAVAEDRLIAWLQLFAQDRGGAPPVGQLVVAWRDEGAAVAELEHLEYRPQAPHGAVEHLILVAIHSAADAGARWIEHRLDDVARLGPALPWQAGNGVARLDAADIP